MPAQGADGLAKLFLGKLLAKPSRERVQREGVRSSCAIGFLLLQLSVFIDELNKDVGDMFIPFAHDPDLEAQ